MVLCAQQGWNIMKSETWQFVKLYVSCYEPIRELMLFIQREQVGFGDLLLAMTVMKNKL